jgi:hypothetical protein
MSEKIDTSKEARMIAILKGNYLAKWFPTIWRKILTNKYTGSKNG